MLRCSSLAPKEPLKSSPKDPPRQHPQERWATINNSAEMRIQSKV